ncbi:MAG: hypothetical protein Q4G22_13175 [Paracoccus sp. (in: a-proteobacteria)]|uniref:hypothetical protein n=1 Tax=Paracoccus sp. TaxID=267 RepID=UPI0026E05457|nr:hypothetical protein [Paracoccus sp. (in: a-proteobacteria)]MDO5632770.1 hypothetical protein [Paracoccus sp. (in: a-proteobacteria)]
MSRKDALANDADESSVIALDDRQIEDVSGGARVVVAVHILRAVWAMLRAR